MVRLQLARVGDDVVGDAGRRGARRWRPATIRARPTAQVVKDVWVVGAGARVRPLAVAAPPQVDFGGSVPKRVADSLYWLGRAAERAEVSTRAVTCGHVAARSRTRRCRRIADGAWAVGAAALLRAAQAAPSAPIVRSSAAVRRIAPDGARRHVRIAAAAQLAALVQEATSVREYLSTTTGRVLGRLARDAPVCSPASSTRPTTSTPCSSTSPR